MKTSMMSKAYARMPEKMKKFLSHNKAMYFNHKYGITKEKFLENEKIRNFFEILTVS